MDAARHPGIATAVRQLTEQTSLAGKTVLEVGADWQEASATMMLEAGAAKVISTNFERGWPTKVSADGRLDRRPLDARRLGELIPARSIDVVFGVAVMEHFSGVPLFFAQALQVLRPGGLLFVQGSPLWTSAKGHHVWVEGKDRHYHFPDATNPIADWSHLYLDRAAMKADLLAKGVPPADAEAIVVYVYDSEEVNRIGCRTMRRDFAASGFREQRLVEDKTAPPSAAELERIRRGRYGDEGPFDVIGLVFIGKA